MTHKETVQLRALFLLSQIPISVRCKSDQDPSNHTALTVCGTKLLQYLGGAESILTQNW